MAFDSLDIEIGASTADAKAAIGSVKSSLFGLESSANDAQDSMEELGDEATGTSTRLSSLAATSGATALSMTGLSSAATAGSGSLTALATSAATAGASLTGIAAVAAPLAAVLGTATAAAGGLATAFGAIIGSGLLAFGKQQAKTMDGASTATEALAKTAKQLKNEIVAIVAPFGKQFVPLIQSAVNGIPDLVQGVINALGPMDQFVAALESFGGAAAEGIPAVISGIVDLGKQALPLLGDLATKAGSMLPQAFKTVVAVSNQVGDDLMQIGSAVVDIIPELTKLGVILIEAAAPAIDALLGGLGKAISVINNVAVALAPVVDLFSGLPSRIKQVIAVGGALLAFWGPLTTAVSAAAGVFSTLIGVLGTVVSIVTTVGSAILGLLGGPITAAIAAIAGLALAWETNFLGIRDKTKSVIKTVGNTVRNGLNSLRSWLSSVWDLHPFSDTFEVVANTIMGGEDSGGIIPTLKSDVQGVFNTLRSWAKTVWDLHPLSGVFETVKSTVVGGSDSGGVIGSLKSGVKDGLGQLRSWAQTVWDLNPLSGVFEAVKSTVVGGEDSGGVIGSLKSGVKDGLGQLRSWAQTVWDLNPLSGVFETVKTAVVGGNDSGGIIETLVRGVTNGLDQLIDYITSDNFNFVEELGDAISDGLDGIVTTVGNFIDGLVDTINQIPFIDQSFDFSMPDVGDLTPDINNGSGSGSQTNNGFEFDFSTGGTGTGDTGTGDTGTGTTDGPTSDGQPADEVDTSPNEDTATIGADFGDNSRSTSRIALYKWAKSKNLGQRIIESFWNRGDVRWQELSRFAADSRSGEELRQFAAEYQFDEEGIERTGLPIMERLRKRANHARAGTYSNIMDPLSDDVNEIIDVFPSISASDIPTAETGGLIDSGGLSMLHAGERVVPEAQVSDRGPAPVEVNMDSDAIVSELRKLRQSVESGDSRVSERDLVRGLERLFDRRGGTV